jgi:hypothetical protein
MLVCCCALGRLDGCIPFWCSYVAVTLYISCRQFLELSRPEQCSVVKKRCPKIILAHLAIAPVGLAVAARRGLSFKSCFPWRARITTHVLQKQI